MEDERTAPSLRRVALIGTCVPRQCGIATFTDDMQRAFTSQSPTLSCITVAVTDTGSSYAYPDFVPLEIDQGDLRSYAVAADFLNVADVDVVSLQHEFGIFGGEDGDHVLELLRAVRAPVVTTLHTVLAEPTPGQRRVTDEIILHSVRLVVMAEEGRRILQEVYGVPPQRVTMIPHGVPDRPFLDAAMAKHDLGLADRTVLMTFGLLGPGKGIETAIRAMPELVRDHPKILYMIVGATHPSLRRQEGERYRDGLIALAADLRVTDHIRFVDRYLSREDLLDHLAACDIYLSPYPNEAQIVSGTLAYAVALGKPVVSTPFWYAQEILANDCGVLVPFGAAGALAGAVGRLIEDDASRSAIRTEAYALGRTMIWENVASKYLKVFARVRFEGHHTGAVLPFGPVGVRSKQLPPLSTEHLAALTDNVGLMQHTQFAVPNRRHGYCLDDNARALLLMTNIAHFRQLSPREEQLALSYAAFVEHAWCHAEHAVHNFMGFNREWLDKPGVDDALGRAVWALGEVARHPNSRRLDSWAAARLLDFAPALSESSSPRAWAYGLLGIEGFLGRFPGHRAFERLRDDLADRLFQRWSDADAPNWNWFEDRLGYDNAKLCEALLVTGHTRSNFRHIQVGLDTLRWLMKLQTAEAGHFRPIGTDTFGADRRHPRPFDQQPLEAYSAVSACLVAANVSGDPQWRQEARRAFNWFLGDNDLRIPVADVAVGACFDGLHPDRRNANQGAESTLAYLASLAAMLLARKHRLGPPSDPTAIDPGPAISAGQDTVARLLPTAVAAKAI